ncbi:MAG TPA: polysaccharide pyruvyl transferase family protein [Myxococcaceae bacterium]|nr:polysaccharide pyruvyl transferase family protein [Myxococcaceae bacterium]
MTGSGRFRNVAFWGNFGSGNLGNEATLAAAIHQVRRRLPGAELRVICTDPAEVQSQHKVHALPIRGEPFGAGARRGPRSPAHLLRRLAQEARGWSESRRGLKGVDLLVMTGTGMLTDSDEGRFGLHYDLFRWATVARLSGATVAVLGVGVEEIHRRSTALLLRAALGLAAHRSYRDLQSRDRLRKTGGDFSGDAICPDLAFGLPPLASTSRVVRATGRRTVALGLYALRNRGERDAAAAAVYRRYLEKLRALFLAVRRRGDVPWLILGDLRHDRPVLEDLQKLLSASGESVPDQGHLLSGRFEALREELAGVDAVVASRFHNVLLALALGKPVVSLGYEAKNAALMESMGVGDFSTDVESFEPAWVLEQLDRWEQQREQRLRMVAERVAEARTALDAQLDRVFG